jgi:hypothetical protein
MMKTKVFASILLALAVLLAQAGSAAAAPQIQDGTVIVTGEVTLIGEPQTDENGVTTIEVTLKDANGVETTVLVSPEVAAALTVGQKDVSLTVNAGDVVPPEEPVEEDFHPISDLLADFFNVDASVIDSFHNGEYTFVGEDGAEQTVDQVFGFGVIAQALWMATDDETGDTDMDLAGAILQAKDSGNYEDVAAMLGWDDEDIPGNWGQFKKALKDKHENLGAAHQNKDKDGDEAGAAQENGKGKDKSKKDKEHGNPNK